MTYKALDVSEEQTIVLEGKSIPIGFNNMDGSYLDMSTVDNFEKMKEFYESKL